jgi:hypothetical protein
LAPDNVCVLRSMLGGAFCESVIVPMAAEADEEISTRSTVSKILTATPSCLLRCSKYCRCHCLGH